MEWYAFTEKHPKAHLLVGEFDPGEPVPRISRFAILGRLVLALQPTGDWAMQKVQRARRTAIYVAYEKRSDAAALRTKVGALPAAGPGRSDRWTTQFEFWFDGGMYTKVVALTAARTTGPAKDRPVVPTLRT
jgi:hypothetical protein